LDALAYGINFGLLEERAYSPVVLKGWQALEEAVSAEGKLGWVQFEAASPGNRQKDEAYGARTFLLAGSDVWKLLEN
jgi:rhamnogalacturonyl hydrolase YesR